MTLNRIKLLTGALIISFISLTSLHANAGEDGSPFEGLYLGLLTSKATFSATATHQLFDDPDFPSIFNPIVSTTSNDSYGGGLLAGYGLSYGLLYTSAEAAFVIDKGNTTFSDGVNTIKISQSNTFEISIRGGFELSDTALVYALVGYSGTNIKSGGINNRQDATKRLTYNKRLTSLRYGAGVEVALFENIALRGEYTRTKINDGVYVDGSDQFTFKPKTSRIMLSVVLHMY